MWARLPERLFATDRYPSRRLNVYSTLDFLVAVKDVLRGTPEMDRIMGSCFGKLFDLPVRRCSYSSVMIHALLARQLVTKKRYEAWPIFGGNPLRFSMVEFGRVTGLPCGEFEEGYVVDLKQKYKEEDYAYWDKLFDGRRDITIPDVVQMVTEDLTISRSRRLKLCLIIIVDGVLIASTQPARPTLKHVKRVENLKNFLAFQWGRESFYWTVSDMIPPKRILGVCNDPPAEFCTKLRQKTKKMTGLPLALQLVAYECIPQLLARLGGTDDQKIIDCESLPQHTGTIMRYCCVHVMCSVYACTRDYKRIYLTVQPMMEIEPDKLEGWGEWDDEIDDRRVKYLVRLIVGGHKFTKSMWRGGDVAEVLYDHEKLKAAKKRKREAGNPKINVEGGHVLKQRRVSTYFRRPTLKDDDKHNKLASRVDALEKVVVWMKKRLGRRKRIGVTPRKEFLCSGGRVKEKKKKSAVADESPNLSVEDMEEESDDVRVDVDDVAIGNEKLPAESEDGEGEEEEDGEESVGEDVESEDEEEEKDVEDSGGEDVGAEDVNDSVGEDEKEDGKEKGSGGTDVQHMEVLVDYVSERHGALLKEKRAMFVDPWFVDHLLGKARSFQAATYKGRVFSDPKLAGYLTQEGKKLGVDVDTVYGPMIWGQNHWVGLAINIRTWSVQVYDSDHSLRSMEEVMVIMLPIAKMLPYLVRKVCPAQFLMGHGLEPFAVERMENVYQNRRSGDCGPVAVKFLELSATTVEQPGVGDLTDNAVNILRKQYAMDVYRDWIVPFSG
ncbi:hypothetical protein BRARA_C00658 [Brassica rapa]|uniref:Ubiquitin-like protease family profile domain-containing protein n=1 Tax=Brassica campestris TaxID=3711 RepID=A0A397ZSC4_BRACM|nr:hypothetical protein BRARA_C00658 [Brassica rapa]